jgi:hypothetical protein
MRSNGSLRPNVRFLGMSKQRPIVRVWTLKWDQLADYWYLNKKVIYLEFWISAAEIAFRREGGQLAKGRACLTRLGSIIVQEEIEEGAQTFRMRPEQWVIFTFFFEWFNWKKKYQKWSGKFTCELKQYIVDLNGQSSTCHVIALWVLCLLVLYAVVMFCKT